MSDILPIIPPLLIVALAIFVIAKNERRLGEKQREWKVLYRDTRSSCLGGTITLNLVYIIMAAYRHITIKTTNRGNIEWEQT